MTQVMTDPHRRVAKREFISRVAARGGWPIKTVASVYEEIFCELMDAVSQGETVVLTGFGRFYHQAHKGHKVHFGQSAVDDYSVLKFSASPIVNRHLERESGLNGEEVVEDERA
ncbi:HU family DNA-binding protein [Kribbella sp. NBC_01245]|uniref:HU family DNA-binding protein n=1 Tax=Kribbella sp. NBC_01245 TaxID=2903578 RepID=UPI002E2BF4F4|nr:HU family DNA-binding protein [Kribbella sp. NBC_01245]